MNINGINDKKKTKNAQYENFEVNMEFRHSQNFPHVV